MNDLAVDKSLTQSMQDARDALVNSCVDMLSAYGNTLTSSQRMGQLPCPYSLRLMPLYVLSLLKYVSIYICTWFVLGMEYLEKYGIQLSVFQGHE